MNDAQTIQLIRRIRKARHEEETILGNEPEVYLHALRNDPRRILRLLQEAGIYDQNGNLTERYR